MIIAVLGLLVLLIVCICAIWQRSLKEHGGEFVVAVLGVLVVLVYTFLTYQQLIETKAAVEASQKAAIAAGTAADAAKAASVTAAGQLAEMVKQSEAAKAQLSEMSRQTEAAIKAANAAQISADTAVKALVDVQRPFLFVSVSKVDVTPEDGKPVDQFNRPSKFNGFPQSVEISIENVQNVGTQMAIIEFAMFRLWADNKGTALPRPDELAQLYHTSGFFRPAFRPCVISTSNRIVRVGQKDAFTCSSQIDMHDLERYKIGDNKITLSGVIQYKDPIGTLREHGVTWSWRGGETPDAGFTRFEQPEYSYDRKR